MLDFLVIGAQKAGTTWLNRKLGKHHEKISFPGGKEVHFWDLFRERGKDWYVGLFSKPDCRLHGDMTPAYAVLPPEVIAECHSLFPNLRLIYTIRDPAERAWSAAKMDALRAGMKIADVPDEWFLSHFRSAESLARGDYETCIRNWLRFYRKEQLLILRFEEILNDPASYLGKCFNHLGLETIYAHIDSCSAEAESEEDAELRAKVREGSPEPLRPSLRPALSELYDFKIRSLSEYLGEDFSAWLAWYDKQAGQTLL
jgi:hypothetical protein